MEKRTLIDRLEEFGLSEKEINMYLTVLNEGEAKTGTIAEQSDVSQRYVYNLAEKLADRGLVEIRDHVMPTKIHAIPPEQTIEQLVEDLQSIQPELERRFTETTPETATFEMIKSRPTVLKRIRSFLSEASEEVFLTLPAGVIEELKPEITAATDRGVAVLLLEIDANEKPDAEAARDRFSGWTSVVRQLSKNTPFVVTADATSGLIGDRGLLTSAHDSRQAIALTEVQLIGSLFATFIGSFWPMGTEAFVAAPAELPATYKMFRPAVLQATLHERRGTDLVMTADVEPINGEERKTITGPVVDTRQGIVEPFTNSFPVESSIVVETDEGTVSIGGEGGFFEDYHAHEVAFRLA